jgi:hypothetical protein
MFALEHRRRVLRSEAPACEPPAFSGSPETDRA